MKSTALGAATLLLSTAAVAQTQPDWRVIAGTPDTAIFCDMSRVRKMPDGHVQVWTKGLPAKDLVRESNKPITKEQTSAAAEKLLRGYKPLVQQTHELTQDERVNFILAEQIANAGKIQPSLRILFEIDCTEQRTPRPCCCSPARAAHTASTGHRAQNAYERSPRLRPALSRRLQRAQENL